MTHLSSHRTAAPEASPSLALERGILRTLAYADVFDHPLTPDEIHRYLVQERATGSAVSTALRVMVPDRVGEADGHFFLRGRHDLVERRRRRAEAAGRLWPVARRYADRIASLPFVRGVGLTGSLARDCADEAPAGGGGASGTTDVDYLVVTEPGRVWVCRAFIGLLSRRARRRGVELCANYVLSEDALALRDRTIYTAHELVQLVPLAGTRAFRRLRAENGWVADFLPNAARIELPDPQGAPGRGRLVPAVETLLRTRLGGWLDRLERGRKLRRSLHQGRDLGEACFEAECFKGHFDGHAARILSAYEQRIRTLEAGGR